MYKKVILNIVSNYINNLLEIYDSNNNLIYRKYANGICYFYFEVNKVYKIKIINSNSFVSNIYVSHKYNDPYIFDVRNIIVNHKIFIRLIDENYKNLLIEKGEIKLWQNHIA